MIELIKDRYITKYLEIFNKFYYLNIRYLFKLKQLKDLFIGSYNNLFLKDYGL